ncbi:Flp pilus assembly protein CpaB [Actinomadura craniellae]|uniref:Flp pilus assembly protein CpaB n=1 Tax=Actinomadura craniellae TaxID=2231787 RepID=A0A365H5P2_9ACTN|nr:Flp pilus assembly protein CpaB [Actinomadura craniellae]RAY14411.1 Flp pilus assembly protein CpaB [Actinomadura craniellae]
MNPRQRRGVLLMILAGLGAIVVFVMVLGYVGNVRAEAQAEVGEYTRVLQLQSRVEAYQPINAASVREVQIPKRWTTDAFVRSVAELQGKVASGPLPPGAYLQHGMVIEAPILKPGQREIAIMIDAETGVAGKVMPGSIVDVYSTFDAVPNSRNAACAVRILSRVQVIDVGQQRASGDGKQPGTSGQVVPVTFALDAGQVLDLTYAESFSRKLRLALVGGTADLRTPPSQQCRVPTATR